MGGTGRMLRNGVTLLAMALALPACGGGGGSPGGTDTLLPTPTPSVTPTPTPTPANTSCALRTRQDWVLRQVNDWYLFPETLGYVNPAAFSTLSDYLDALTAGARSRGMDRYFSYVTSIAEENAYYESGATAGFGFRLHVDGAERRLWVSEAFEGAPALAAGLDRGTEILALGSSPSTMRTVSLILESQGDYGLYIALGADTPGLTRSFQIRNDSGTRTVTVTKTDYAIEPVSPRYGLRIIEDEGRKIGYVNLRTFIFSAEDPLRTAFAELKAQGVDELIVDLRYNGGGLLAVAQTLGSLMGAGRGPGDVFTRLRYRPEQGADEAYPFLTEPSAIAPRRIAFIATGDTASASELVINAFRPYLRADIALIGANSYGKPVGQIAIDRPECDDRLRLIAFAVDNAERQGGYYQGLASVMEQSCRADDDLTWPLGDRREASIARAIDFLDRRTCTPIGPSAFARTATVSTARVPLPAGRHSLVPATPSQPQRDMPGLF